MEKKYLIVNPGSASRKFALYEGSKQLIFCHLEDEDGGFVATYDILGKKNKVSISEDDYKKGGAFFLSLLSENNLISQKEEIAAIGFRIVAPGEYFSAVKKMDSGYIEKLKEVSEKAPLHTAGAFVEINEFSELLPDATFVGISDSAFHSDMPDIAREYAITSDMREAGIKRYGYHGISFSYIASKMKDVFGSMPEKVIVCHLGGGSSITALKNGKSVDTSMGFTPLEGLVMATRSGNIDVGAAIEIARNKKIPLEEVEQYLNKECGLLGVSGSSSDIRELLKKESEGDKYSSLALQMFVYRIKRYIGSYIAALGGLDALIFTATVGERSYIMRSRICENMDFLGIVLDESKNKGFTGEGSIEAASSRVKIAVIPTDETSEMARETRDYLKI